MPAMSFTVPHSAPAFRNSFGPSPISSKTTTTSHRPGRTSIQVRRRSALGQSILFASESDSSDDEQENEKEKGKRKSIDSFSSADSEQEEGELLKTPEDEAGPCQPLIVGNGATSAQLMALGEAKDREGKERRLSADELRKRLGRVAGAPQVVQQQVERQQTQVKAPPSVGLKHCRPDPRKQLGLRAAMGSYQERRRSIGHRRSQSSGSVDLCSLELDPSPVPAQELTIRVTAPPTPQPVSIRVTPASPELVRSVPLPDLPSHSHSNGPISPRRIASDSGVPSLDQIRKWAIKRDPNTNISTNVKATIMIQDAPLSPSCSAERAKARAALENLQPGGGIPRRSRSAGLKMTPVTVSVPTINVTTPDMPPRLPTVRTNFAPVRAFSLPQQQQPGAGAGARAAQAQSMMARLSMRGATTGRRAPTPGAGVGGMM